MGTDYRIPCSEEARDAVRAQKRGGETYSDVLMKMANQYDPEAATENDDDGN